jgi:uncharacterized protein
MTVVEDSDDHIALFIAHGTPTRRRVALDGTPIDRSSSYADRSRIPWRLGRGEWRGSSALQLQRAGAPYAFWAFFAPETWALEGWYVNLQQPLQRTSIGFDTVDHVLDVVIAPDLSSWEWKDAHELDDAVRVGRFSPEEAVAVRSHGEQAVAALEARAWPFDRSWETWRPDPSWKPPALQDEWSRTAPKRETLS